MPGAKFSKLNDFLSTVAGITPWAGHWEQSLNYNIALEMEGEQARAGRPWLQTWERSPGGGGWGGRGGDMEEESSPSKAPAVCQMLHIHSRRDYYALFTVVELRPQLVKPPCSGSGSQSLTSAPHLLAPSSCPPPTPPHTPASLAAFCGK